MLRSWGKREVRAWFPQFTGAVPCRIQKTGRNHPASPSFLPFTGMRLKPSYSLSTCRFIGRVPHLARPLHFFQTLFWNNLPDHRGARCSSLALTEIATAMAARFPIHPIGRFYGASQAVKRPKVSYLGNACNSC